MLQAYRDQYDFPGIFLLPVNLYGPGDNFDLASSHVIPAMIRKFVAARDAGEKSVTLWGTGAVTREFLYVGDCAEAIVRAADSYDSPEPVNIGSGHEIAISTLAKEIRDLVGFKGEILWDAGMPDGQPRRRLDTSRAEREFGFRAKTDLRQGLESTIAWWAAKTRSLHTDECIA